MENLSNFKDFKDCNICKKNKNKNASCHYSGRQIVLQGHMILQKSFRFLVLKKHFLSMLKIIGFLTTQTFSIFEIENFCNKLKTFTDTFDQINAHLCKVLINLTDHKHVTFSRISK